MLYPVSCPFACCAVWPALPHEAQSPWRVERYIALDMFRALESDIIHATLCVLTLCISLPRCISLVVNLSHAAADDRRVEEVSLLH